MFNKMKDIMSKKKKTDKPEVDATIEEQNNTNTPADEQTVETEAQTEEMETSTETTEDDTNVSLQQEYDELKDKYMRMLAEFDNFKKRTVREKLHMMNTAAADTMSVILPVLDDFDRAKKTADAEDSTEVFSEGVTLVYNKLHSILKQKGLTAMESTGAAFDPELHEALTEIPAPTEDMKGKIIDTIEKGYLLKEKIIRHAKVVVGK